MKKRIANCFKLKAIKFPTIVLLLFVNGIVSGQTFQKNIDRNTLEAYLAKSLNAQQLNDYCKTPNGFYSGLQVVDNADLNSTPTQGSVDYTRKQELMNGNTFALYNDLLRIIKKTKAKLITDAVSQWGAWDWYIHLNRCSMTVRDIKSLDNDIIVQASLNEYADRTTAIGIGQIPSWVWSAFGLTNENRNFNVYNMTFSDVSTNEKHWWPDAGLYNGLPEAIVPDINKIESKMWFYYQGVKFIDMGCESLNFSQVGLMNNWSDDPTAWNDVFFKLKQYADAKSNIRFLLITGHTYGMKDNRNRLAFDFHTCPTRPSELGTNIMANGGSCDITANSCNWPNDPGKIYQRSLGGITPSGWYCSSLPSLVFLDNYGNSETNSWGTAAGTGTCSTYNFDEITWFALQNKQYRDDWLKYAYYKVRCLDPVVYFSLPIKRVVTYREDWYPASYLANNPNNSFLPAPYTVGNVPDGYILRQYAQLSAGYGQEDVIKNILDGTYSSGSSWFHHNFTEEKVVNPPAKPEVASSLVLVSDNKMYYIGTDNYIHGYIKDNSDSWWTVSPTYACQLSANNQAKASSNLVASPDGKMLLYIGYDGYVHGFNIDNEWSYTYFDFVKTEMIQQNLKASNSLIFPENDRAYYIALETTTNEKRVHGFNKVNGVWTTISPTYSQLTPPSSQTQPSGGLTYSSSDGRLYYVGIDGFLYYFKSINYWQYTYNEVPKTELINQQLRILPFKLAIWNNRIYYIGLEAGNSIQFRIHALIDNNGIWSTVSPTHSANSLNGQPLNSQQQASGTEIAVSPNGEFISYIGQDLNIHYYKNLGNSNFSYNDPNSNDVWASSNSLQYQDDNTLFYVSNHPITPPVQIDNLGDLKVHFFKNEESYCENRAIRVIESERKKEAHSDIHEKNKNLLTNYKNSLKTTGIFNPVLDSVIKEMAVNVSPLNIEIYPNPTSSNINIDLPITFPNQVVKLRLTNMLGVISKLWELNTVAHIKLSLSDVPSGVYVLSFLDNNDNIITNKKVVVQR